MTHLSWFTSSVCHTVADKDILGYILSFRYRRLTHTADGAADFLSTLRMSHPCLFERY